MREEDQEALRGALGAEGVALHDPVEVEGAAVEVTLTPRSAGALAAALHTLDERKLSVLVRGGGSRLSLGNLPERVDALLSTEHLEGISELDADEGVAQVRAGTRLALLAERAREAGWEVPLDPPGQAATLGGVVAAGATGPRALRFGPVRDAVLGLDVVLANGARTRCGGRVVKNVTGYDLNKLYTGSLGTLGVVESVWLRLRPLPECAVILEASVESNAVFPIGLELSRRPSAKAVVGEGERLVVELAGEAPAVGADRRWLEGITAAREAPEATLDEFRQRTGEGGAPGATLLRVAALPAALGAANAPLARVAAHVLVDFGRSLLFARFDTLAATEVDEAIAVAREASKAGGGEWRIEAAPTAARDGREVFGDPGPEVALFRALKDRYDPGRVLNPGRAAGRF